MFVATGYFYNQVDFGQFAYSGGGFQFTDDANTGFTFLWGPTFFGPISLGYDYEDLLISQPVPLQADVPYFYASGVTVAAGAVTGGVINGLSLGAAGSGFIFGLAASATALEAARATPGAADDIAWLRVALGGDDNLSMYYTSTSADAFFGGAGNDRMYGYAGTDALKGDAGLDTIAGGADADTIFGGLGADSVLGEGGGDLLFGGAQNDRLFGGAGHDTLKGEAGIDRLVAGSGDDRVAGGLAADSLTGNSGNDLFVFLTLAECGDAVTDFAAVTGNDDRFVVNAAGFGGGLVVGVLATSQFQTRADNVAQDADDRFIFRTPDQTLWFDANGAAAGGLTLVADMQAGAVVAAADILLV